MLECPNCFAEVKIGSSTCDVYGFLLPKNQKVFRKAVENKDSFFSLPDSESIITTKEWIFFILILCIPFLNIYFLYKYGFKDSQESSIRNFSRAIFFLILIYLGFHLAIMLFGFLFELFQWFLSYAYMKLVCASKPWYAFLWRDSNGFSWI